MTPKLIKDYINNHLIIYIELLYRNEIRSENKLYKHQEDIIDKLLDKPKILPIVSSRQCGMSTLFDLFSVAYCLFVPETTIVIFATSLRNVIQHGQDNKIILEKISLYEDIIDTIRCDAIIFKNKSKILYLNAQNPDSIRGINADFTFFNDFAFYSKQKEIFMNCLPNKSLVVQSCADHSGSFFHLVCLSNPNTIKVTPEPIKNREDIIKAISYESFQQQFQGVFIDKSEEKDSLMNLRVSYEEKSEIAKNAEKYGFKNVSEYLRVVALDRDLFYRLDRNPERNVFQVDTGTKLNDEERIEYIKNRLKELQYNETSENRTWINSYKAELICLENKKKPFFSESFTNLHNSICKKYLFGIGLEKSETLNDITSLISKIDIDEEKVIITYLIDEKNTLENFIRANNRFYVIWLDRTGTPVGSLGVPNNIEKVFPISFSNEGPGSVLGKIIIKR
jgi:hypothetical protein